ncbi:type II toxin-antitoxin system RelE/ParE family toxin [Methylopila turkensis]|uniref:Type II toxin-antitoxin system RelE/ParE family toxin n=1 Tax=Methylopila turkensis TaxID=1437816 RepID=A0A9W6JMX4_9HYPH|nr:type II toxin-antitoxin system RelE/ParE family toxin [Methylopila turkensis]GLK80566.1 hypothetical protein GCM10008174_23070 [Methylopila turkensis]
MRFVVYTSSALRNIDEIIEYVARESGSVAAALRLAEDIADRCLELSSLPGTLGRPRDDLSLGLRSVTFKSYVIFFRYHRAEIEVVNVLHGHRDIEAFFRTDMNPS